MMDKDSNHKEIAGLNARSVTISLAALAILFFIAGIIPVDNLWGINHLRYFPAFTWVIYAILFGLVLIPPIAVVLSERAKAFSGALNRIPIALRIIFVAVIAGLVFYLLRVHVHSLGDGYLRIYQVQKGLTFLHTEPLDFSLHAYLFKLLNLFGTVSGEATYILYSVVCGSLFVPAVLFLKFPKPLDGKIGAFIKTAVLSFGGLQLFFGYVESYSLLYPAILLFMLYAVCFFISGRYLIPASIMICLVMASHMVGLFFLPAFLYMLYHNYSTVRPQSALKRAFPPAILALTLFMLFIVVFVSNKHFAKQFGSSTDLLLPFISSGGYAIFSSEHIFNLFNQLLVIAPIAMVFGVVFMFSGKEKSPIPGVTVFLGIMAGISLLILLVIDPKLGYARDWDLFSSPAAIVGLAIIIYGLVRLSPKKSDMHLFFSIGMTGVLIVSSWILTNSSTPRQLKRAEELLFISDRGHGYCTELLAHYYRYEAKNNEKVLELLSRISGAGKNARVYYAMATTEMDLGMYNDALQSARKGLELDSSKSDLYFVAGSAYMKMNNPDSSLPYIVTAYYKNPDNYLYTQMLGRVYNTLGLNEHALNAFKASNQSKPDYAYTYFDIGSLYFDLGQLDSAYMYVQQGLKLDPNYGEGYKMLDAIRLAAGTKR